MAAVGADGRACGGLLDCRARLSERVLDALADVGGVDALGEACEVDVVNVCGSALVKGVGRGEAGEGKDEEALEDGGGLHFDLGQE